MRVAFFRASAGRSPFAARIARATARSKAVPDFGRSAGARFTTTFFGGTGNPTCRSAERTRSRHSFTAASGRPTIVRPGRPAPIAASTTTVRPSRPDTVAEYARATIIVPASVHDGEREDERLSGLERVGRTYAVLAPNLVDAHAVARGDREERVASLHDVADETRRGRGLGRGCCGRVDEPLRGNRDSGGRRRPGRRGGGGGAGACLPGTMRTVPFFGRAVRGRSFQSHSSVTEIPARFAIFCSVSPLLTTMRFWAISGAAGSAASRGARSSAKPTGMRRSYEGTPCGVVRVLSSLLRSWRSGSVLPVRAATRTRSVGLRTFTMSQASGGSGTTLNPKRAGSFAMSAAARMNGT